jgi:AcrR family transcriptional regulator
LERQARRASVLRHAKRIFARKGYHRTNITDIITRAGIARGTFYLYFRNKRELFEELLAQALGELNQRIRRIRIADDEQSPLEQLRANLRRVVEFVLAERDLAAIMLNHAMGLDRVLDARIGEFYDEIAAKIQRSLDLGAQMHLVRECDTRTAAYCILGVVKEIVGQISRHPHRDTDALVEEMLAFGLKGVAREELLRGAGIERVDGAGFFSAAK